MYQVSITYRMLFYSRVFYGFSMKRIIHKLGQGRAFIFGLPTKSVELLNGLCAFFFSMTFLIAEALTSRFEIYRNFIYIDMPVIWMGMLLVSITQFRLLFRDTLESNIGSVLILRLSCVVWFSCALLFGVDSLLLNTEFFTYSSISFLCLIASLELGNRNSYEELLRKECRND